MSTEVIAIRLLTAIAIGGAVGYERKYNNRPAGFRTHILVMCRSSCYIYDTGKFNE
ncbi:MAG: MgtC/SapB family protein [Clostridium cochlearium]|nr:MgtC/SapB family protein [Clostridium cochlearium]MDU1443004.1 MgtC/SapB family protein [Clostridium cochlearium]